MSLVKWEEQKSPKCRKKKENAFVYIWCPDRNVLIRDIQGVDKINMILIKKHLTLYVTIATPIVL